MVLKHIDEIITVVTKILKGMVIIVLDLDINIIVLFIIIKVSMKIMKIIILIKDPGLLIILKVEKEEVNQTTANKIRNKIQKIKTIIT